VGAHPPWSKDSRVGYSLINARAETVAEKPAFRAAFRSRRCLIPASGLYEWQATGGKHKQPYFIRMTDGAPFAFAGLWERWHGGSGEPVETCAILTTEANALVRPVHERMPVVQAPADFAAWLDPRSPAHQLHGLLRPYPPEEMTAVPVGRYVSNLRNEGPQCLASRPCRYPGGRNTGASHELRPALAGGIVPSFGNRLQFPQESN
jgi:putative SOS response-associated peptidase YedK